MTSFLRKALPVAAGLILAAVPFVLRDERPYASDGAEHGRVDVPRVRVLDAPDVRFFATPDYPSFFAGLDAMTAQAADRFLDATARFLASLPSPVPTPGTSLSGTGIAPAGGDGGTITQEQFAALNQCEASGENGWRTGRYGLEFPYPIGGWSIEQQQAKAQEIFDRAGAHAWGPMCAPILGG